MKVKLPRRNSKRRPKTKLAKLPGSLKLARAAYQNVRANWKTYTKIIAVVVLPSDIIMQTQSAGSDSTVGSYVTIATILMNVALLWAIVRKHNNQSATVPEAYYDGTGAFVRFLLTTVTLVICLIPFAMGAALYMASLSDITASLFSPVQLLVGVVWLALTLPSFFLVVRYGLAPITLMYKHLRPIAALRYSWNLTRHRFWALVGRFIILGLFLILLSLPGTILATLLALIRLSSVGTVVFEVVTTLLALPFANLYLLEIADHLDQTQITDRSEPSVGHEAQVAA